MVTKQFTVTLALHVRAESEKDLPDQREVENLTCALLLTPPATDTDTRWDVYATQVKKNE